MRKFVYVLRNKGNGMWFCESYNKEIKDWEQHEYSDLDNLEDGAFYIWLDRAESWSAFYSRKYNLPLEIVKLEKIAKYREVE